MDDVIAGVVVNSAAQEYPEIRSFVYGSKRVAINIELGRSTVCLRLNRVEIDYMIEELESPWLNNPRPANVRTVAWWEWEYDPPKLALYRDDWFWLNLTHEVGQKLLGVLKQVPEVIPEPMEEEQ